MAIGYREINQPNKNNALNANGYTTKYVLLMSMSNPIKKSQGQYLLNSPTLLRVNKAIGVLVI
jgi:hypothetical protein